MLDSVENILGLGEEDYHRWNLSNLAHLLLVFDTKLDLTKRGEQWCYREMPSFGQGLSKHDETMAWLMNETECPTTWEPLLRIRRANPRFNTTARPTY